MRVEDSPMNSSRIAACGSSMAENVMKDLKADWRRWTRIERIAAVLAVFGMSSIAPALLFLGPW
jgi:hypothetical protein